MREEVVPESAFESTAEVDMPCVEVALCHLVGIAAVKGGRCASRYFLSFAFSNSRYKAVF